PELARGARAAVQQRHQHRGAGGVADQARGPGDVGVAGDVAVGRWRDRCGGRPGHVRRGAPEPFGRDRNIAPAAWRFRRRPFVVLATRTRPKEIAMGTYLLAYRGGGMPETDAEREESMKAWGAFLGGLGNDVVDAGNPFGPAATIAASGGVSDGAASGISGYSIISAGSLGDATSKAKSCPML